MPEVGPTLLIIFCAACFIAGYVTAPFLSADSAASSGQGDAAALAVVQLPRSVSTIDPSYPQHPPAPPPSATPRLRVEPQQVPTSHSLSASLHSAPSSQLATSTLPLQAPLQFVPSAVPPATEEVAPSSCAHPTECKDACAAILVGIRDNRKHSNWNVYYNEIADFLIARKAVQVAEIGTAWGGLAKRLLEKVPSLQLHCVDPFLGGYDPKDSQSESYKFWQGMLEKRGFKLTAKGFSDVYAHAMAYDQGTVNGFGCKYVLHHKLSLDAASDFADGSLDAVFIDGLHTFEGVRDDIAAWTNKVKPGGVLMFNDYRTFPGVKKAVEEYAAERAHGLSSIKVIGLPAHGNVYINK